MIFKSSYKASLTSTQISSSTVYKVVIDEHESVKTGSLVIGTYLLLITSDNQTILVQVTAVNSNNIFEYTISAPHGESLSDVLINMIIVLGNISNNNDRITGPHILTINSEDNASNFYFPRGLTLANFQGVDSASGGVDLIDYNVFLGDLSTFNKTSDMVTDAKPYGLYSNNVILNGSLVTEYQDGDTTKYAGIDTLSSVKSEQFRDGSDPDNSPIVLWAGAPSADAEGIVKSSFHVTSDGSLYAAKGRFKGSIITDSSITASALYTPIIYGNGGGSNPALKIFDASGGVVFYAMTSSASSTESPILQIKTDGMYKYANNIPYAFISFDSEIYPNIIGASLKIGNSFLSNNGLYYITTDRDNNYVYKSGIDINNTNIAFKVGSNDDLNAKMRLYTDSIDMLTNVKLNSNRLYFRNFYYQSNENGIDLYIKENN